MYGRTVPTWLPDRLNRKLPRLVLISFDEPDPWVGGEGHATLCLDTGTLATGLLIRVHAPCADFWASHQPPRVYPYLMIVGNWPAFVTLSRTAAPTPVGLGSPMLVTWRLLIGG